MTSHNVEIVPTLPQRGKPEPRRLEKSGRRFRSNGEGTANNWSSKCYFRTSMDIQWPTQDFMEELKAKAYAATLKLMSNPSEEYEIDYQRLKGYRLQDLAVEFSRLSVVIQNGRRAHYILVRHDIGPPPKNAPMLPLFTYDVEFSPTGEFLDEYFSQF